VLRLTFSDTSAEGFGLRVFWCGWVEGKGAAAENLPLPWGAGWKRDPVRGTMVSQSEAELILRASPRPLFLELEADSPVQAEIRNLDGMVMAAFPVGKRAVQQLELKMDAGLRVLRLTAPGPFRSYGVDWKARRKPWPPCRISLPRPSSTPMAAAISRCFRASAGSICGPTRRSTSSP